MSGAGAQLREVAQRRFSKALNPLAFTSGARGPLCPLCLPRASPLTRRLLLRLASFAHSQLRDHIALAESDCRRRPVPANRRAIAIFPATRSAAPRPFGLLFMREHIVLYIEREAPTAFFCFSASQKCRCRRRARSEAPASRISRAISATYRSLPPPPLIAACFCHARTSSSDETSSKALLFHYFKKVLSALFFGKKYF